MQPVSGVDWLLFGVVSAVAHHGHVFPLNSPHPGGVPVKAISLFSIKTSMPRNDVAALFMIKSRRLKFGQWFRNTHTLGCIARIRAATARDIEELQQALASERTCRRRRKKLSAFLQKRITELFSETAVSMAA